MTTPARNRVDLHAHTARSDGVLPPVELYAAMRTWGIRIGTVSDHDTLDGYRELRDAALGGGWLRGTGFRDPDPRRGPLLVPGVEINSVARGTFDLASGEGELHILGLGVDPDDAAFEATLAGQRRGRTERTDEILERLRDLGMSVDARIAETLPPGVSSPGRPHIARALVAAGFADSVDDAMRRILSPGSPAYVPRAGLGPRDAIEAIRGAGGIPSLAHFREAPDRIDLIRRLRDWGLGAIEAYHSSFDAETASRMAALAEAEQLLPTGGSDYHGDTWTYAEAQSVTHVPDAAADRLLEALTVH